MRLTKPDGTRVGKDTIGAWGEHLAAAWLRRNGRRILYRNYRAPGKRYGISKRRIVGAIAVTRQRVVVWGAGRQVDVPLGYPGVEIARDGEAKVMFAFEASAFHTDRSGRVEVRLRTPSAARIVDLCAVSARLP